MELAKDESEDMSQRLQDLYQELHLRITCAPYPVWESKHRRSSWQLSEIRHASPASLPDAVALDEVESPDGFLLTHLYQPLPPVPGLPQHTG